MRNLTGKYYFNKTDGKYRFFSAVIFEHTFQRDRCGICLKNIFFFFCISRMEFFVFLLVAIAKSFFIE